MSSVSLCMIVKDEEDFLDICLKYVSPLVDEIIIMDTGSTDSTPEIAKKYATTYLEEEWQWNFSYHRNKVLELAQCDWVFSIDGDEIITPFKADCLRKWATYADARNITMVYCVAQQFGFEFPIVLKQGTSTSGFPLFKNNIGYKWYGHRHNKLSITPATLVTPYNNTSITVPDKVDKGVHRTSFDYMGQHFGRLKRNWSEDFADFYKWENPTTDLDSDTIPSFLRKKFLEIINVSEPSHLERIGLKMEHIGTPFYYIGPYPEELDKLDWLKRV